VSVAFGRKGVFNRSKPRFSVSDGNIISQNKDGEEINIYLSKFAISKLYDHKIVRIDITFKGTNETRSINNYILVGAPMDNLKFIGVNLCYLCKLRKVG
jgi:hypothetical protein